MAYHARILIHEGYYFITLVTHNRRKLFRSAQVIYLLKEAFRFTSAKHRTKILAIVVMPDHLHFILDIDENSSNFSVVVKMIKTNFTKLFRQHYPKFQNLKIWQGSFWDHYIRSDNDLYNHIDYIHYNPVKHGFVTDPLEWEHSSIKRFIDKNYDDRDWTNINCGIVALVDE